MADPANHHHRQTDIATIRTINPTAMATIRLLIDCLIIDPDNFFKFCRVRVLEMAFPPPERPTDLLRDPHLISTFCRDSIIQPERSPALIHPNPNFAVPQIRVGQRT
jgi:hypothetical protein